MNLKLLKKPRLKSRLAANGKTLEKVLISLIVVVMVLGTFFYLFQSRDLEKTVLGNIFGGFIADLVSEKEDDEKEFISEQETEVYTETAERGDGLTHLARRALSNYVEENEITNLTDEHKIYIEDYIQKELGSYSLFLGQEVEISQDLISEAVNESRELSGEQLNNLKQYSVLVSSL